LRTMMLVRERLNKRHASVAVRIGGPIAAEKVLTIPSDEERTEYLRWRTYLLASRNEYKPRTALPFMRPSTQASELQAIVPPADVLAMAREVAALPEGSRLAAAGDLSAFLARAHDIPA